MRTTTLALALTVTLGCSIPEHSSRAQNNDPTPPQSADAITSGEACRAQLDARHATFSLEPPIVEGDCAIPVPVKLRSLATGDHAIAFSAEPLLDCALAVRLTDWIGNVVEPLASHHLKSGLTAVETGPGYACRNQNNAATGKRSEHAKGNAIDIAAFALRDGSRIAVRPADQPKPAVSTFLAAVRTTACGYFLTTLGPGSDAAHAEHLHLDLRARTAGFRICQ